LWIQNPPTYNPKITKFCEKLGAKVQIFTREKLTQVEERAKTYVDNSKDDTAKVMLIPFGLGTILVYLYLLTSLLFQLQLFLYYSSCISQSIKTVLIYRLSLIYRL
jgi:hypothetical protein